ncbi:MAG: hypothetical protein D0528_01015 [Methylococcales bacterium]|nr:MAG: hypothetical protein D0528_01015 [Methylococcales bacterium]
MKYNFKMTTIFKVTLLASLLGVTPQSIAAEETAAPIDHHRHKGGHMHMSHGDDSGMDIHSERFAAIKKLADKACADCHGTAGISKTDETPNLAGQEAIYFCKSMYDYRSRARNLPPVKDADGLYLPNMNEVTDKLTDQQIVDLSDYYAHLRIQ